MLKNACPAPVGKNFSGMKIAMEKTTADAYVGLDYYEDDIVIPGNVLIPWPMNSSNSTRNTSYLNKNTATVSY